MIQKTQKICMILFVLASLTACQTISKSTSKATEKVGSWFGMAEKVKVPEIDAKGVVDISKTTLEQVQHLTMNMPTGQWVYIENDLQGIYSLQNKAEDGHILSFKLNCKLPNQKASFSVLDKSRLEVLRAHDSNSGSIQFLLDNKNYGNPFNEISPKKLEKFKTDLKTTKVIKIFNSSKLYKFQNNKVELLDREVSC